MIEKIILDYLNTHASTPAYMERPEEKPEGSYIILEKTGSTRENFLFSSTFTVQSYAPTLYEAATLNEEIKGLLLDDILEIDEITGTSLNSDYNFTNTADKQPRYQAVIVFDHY